MNDSAKITYISSDKIICPVCDYILQREELHGGRGRIVVDRLTEELRYKYTPSEKYGVVIPLLYPITTCPRCRYAAFKNDFTHIVKQTISHVKRTQHSRDIVLRQIFPEIDFRNRRGLAEGIASYYYAMLCYQYWPPESGPTVKQAMSALRIAWLCTDFHELKPEENWDAMARIFYKKARYFYRLAWEQDRNHKENIPSDFNLGPDSDKNYGIDGVCYLMGYLEYRWGPSSDAELRQKNLQEAKALLSKIFDTDRDRKPVSGIILDNTRSLFAAINTELKDTQ